MQIQKINKFLSTLNFILLFVGYELATSLFLPTSSNIEGISRTITVPYRAFTLALSLIVIILNFRKTLIKYPFGIKVLFFYWIILIVRIFYDLNFRPDIYINETFQLWMYIFAICIPTIISIIKSYNDINLNVSLYWIISLIAITLIISLFSNQEMLVSSSEATGRQDANLAFDTISYGHLGTMGILLSLYLLIERKSVWIIKIFVILLIILSTFSMLRAGSRGPIMALLVVALFWIFSRGKNIFVGILIFTLSFILILLFLNQILDFIGNISPIMEERLKASIYEQDTSAREPYYKYAFQVFLDYPIYGNQFAIFRGNGGFIYPHNLILEALMGMGILGGVSMLYLLFSSLKKSYVLINKRTKHFWISLILIQQIMFNMTSSAFYYNYLLSALITTVFIYYQHIKNVNTKIE